MCSCRIGMSLVTGIEFPELLLSIISGVSLDGVLECPKELGVTDPDCLESRPSPTMSSCSSILKEGIGGLCTLATGFRRSELLERLERLESICSADVVSFGGTGGRPLRGTAGSVSAIALSLNDLALLLLSGPKAGINLGLGGEMSPDRGREGRGVVELAVVISS